jgi:glycosyltransferase involved in cell wall biosynthesis
MSREIGYVAVTPARNEAENLRRLAACLAKQTVRPSRWVIVDDGSTDDTAAALEELEREHAWVRVLAVGAKGAPRRGGPVVRAFVAGLELLEDAAPIVVKLDADVSMEPNYFERLLAAFAADPSLGIASGSGYELDRGAWVQRHTTGTSVWGATRAYRWRCLQDVLPLEERIGWDGIDEFKASLRGWRTRTLVDLPFRHHRREGARDGSRRRAWLARGRAARYMGYRPWYLVLRALHYAKREPAAFFMLSGWAGAALRREQRHPDDAVRAELRRRQSLRHLRTRRREALGIRDAS